MKKLLKFLGFEIGNQHDKWAYVSFRFLPLNWILAFFVVYLSCEVLFGTMYTLKRTEKAAIEVFGAYSHEVGPGGLHFKVPIISRVRRVPTEMRHRWELGFRTEGKDNYVDVPEESTMLTKGGHIGVVNWIFQYSITDVYSWLYRVKDPKEVLDKLSQGSMRLIVGQTPLDDILTNRKIDIQNRNKSLFQKYCNSIGLKVIIQEVKLQDCGLPSKDVKTAYDDVMNAEKDRDRFVQQAEGYHNDVVPKAKGKAAETLNKARGYYTQQTNGAKGEIARFMGVLEEYRKDPITTEKKLWYEAMQQVLSGADITILENQNLLNLKQH